MKTVQDIKQPSESRQANHKLLKIFDKFEVVQDDNCMMGTCGNIRSMFEKLGNNLDGKWIYNTQYGKAKKYQQPFMELVSAPMLLARLVSAGCVPIVSGQEGYKVTWSIILRHKKSKGIVTFYDYKGASSYGSDDTIITDELAHKDVLTLLKSLINPKFPHPYDDCVVGEIA